SRLWTGNGVAIASPATPGKASPKRPNRRKASPPQVNVRAAVVSAIWRIASCGKPRRTAHAPNAAPAAAWTHSVPRPKTKPGGHHDDPDNGINDVVERLEGEPLRQAEMGQLARQSRLHRERQREQ